MQIQFKLADMTFIDLNKDQKLLMPNLKVIFQSWWRISMPMWKKWIKIIGSNSESVQLSQNRDSDEMDFA